MRFILRKQIDLTIFFVLLSTFTCKLYAQQYDKAIVKISQKPIDITALAKTIAKQTGLEYSLNMQNASLKKRITLHTGNWQLADILKQVQQQAGLNYRILGDHILFMDYQPPVNKTTKTNEPGQPTHSAKDVTNPKANGANTAAAIKAPVSAASQPKNIATANNKSTAQVKATKSATTQAARAGTKPMLVANSTQPAAQDRTSISAKENVKRPSPPPSPLLPVYAALSNYVTPKVFSLALIEDTDSAGNKKLPSRLTVPSLMKNIAAAKAKQKENSNRQQRNESSSGSANADDLKWYKPFANVGVSTNEILYFNASMMAGIKYLYGIVSYGGGAFSGGRIRWGAGIPVKLNDDQKLHFSFTTGTMKRTTNPDSAIVYGVKETLTRYGAGWSKIINPRITFQAELHYNILKKTSDSTSVFAQNQTGDYKRFEYGRVPYALSESYGTEGDFKRWIGLQISFFYKLF